MKARLTRPAPPPRAETPPKRRRPIEPTTSITTTITRSHLRSWRSGSRRSSRCWSRRGWSTRRARRADRHLRDQVGPQTAPGWWRGPGSIRPSRRGCCSDATAAIASLGFAGRQGEHMLVVENTRRSAQPRGLHAVLLLSMAGAGAAAGLVQIGAVSRARRDRPARRARASSAWSCPRTSRSGSGTRPPRCVIWCCPSGRRGPKA